jgi:putative flavoprotein involved in K+ transport
VIRIDTVVVGAGQAGLALSRRLTEEQHEHVLLERGRIAERWRSERWDSFRLLTPNWQTRLPSYQYRGPDPDGFMARDEIVRFFDGYAASFAPPVETEVTVHRVARRGGRWLVASSAGDFVARNVVVATGHYDYPRTPVVGDSLPPWVAQLHARDYRNPASVPDGGVLVVGAGPTGQQLADELARHGRPVFLAVGRHRPLPRRYRGRDVYWWLERMGSLARTIDSIDDPGAAANAPSAVLAGGLDDLNLHRLVRNGVRPLGRLLGGHGRRLRFGDDLVPLLAAADANTTLFRSQVDAYAEDAGLDVPATESIVRPESHWARSAPRELDLAAAGVRSVIWATGYRRDYSWIDAPVFDSAGEPVQRRGVTAASGLMFLGLRWMYRRNSNFIDGVHNDADHLARRIVGYGVDGEPAPVGRQPMPSSTARSAAIRREGTSSLSRTAAT